MAGIIVVDRIESDASYASSINIASPLVVANTVSFSQPVTVSNTFVVPAGTVSAPAITPTGDTNTGIYFPAADNIGFATNGVIRGRWTTDGLCFGSDTAAANALDDYEEGTWTPQFSFDGNSVAMTYTIQVGLYTKIGRQVTISGIIYLSNKGTSTGTLRFQNLPFTINSTTNHYIGFATYVEDINAGQNGMVMWGASPNTTFFVGSTFNCDTNSQQQITHAEAQNGTQLRFSLSYTTA